MRVLLKPAGRAALSVVAGAALVASAHGVAAGLIPGEYRVAEVFPVDDQRVQVAVQSPDLEAGTVSGSVQNNTDDELICTGVRDEVTGTVGAAATATRADIVARSVDFLAEYPYSPLAPLVINVEAPSGMGGPQIVDLGSVTGMVPGSLAEGFWPDLAAMSVIGQLYDEARMHGQVGRTGSTITVPARTSEPFTVDLEQASAGGHHSFEAGVMLTCEMGPQRYVFHGYENGRPSHLPKPTGETGRFSGS